MNAVTAPAGTAAGPRSLWAVHRIAARPAHVYGIAAGIVASVAAVEVVTLGLGLGIAEPAPGLRQAEAFRVLVREGHWLALAALFAWLTVLWATYGGGVTRRLLQQLRGERGDSLWQATRFCLRPALLAPSALASACFLFLLATPTWPWMALPVLPVWLCAGFLYGPLTDRRIGLVAAVQVARRRIGDARALLRRQRDCLGSFLLSTALVYVVCAAWIALLWAVTSGMLTPMLLVLIAPAALYALGYTTSNLKALQLHLYLTLRP